MAMSLLAVIDSAILVVLVRRNASWKIQLYQLIQLKLYQLLYLQCVKYTYEFWKSNERLIHLS